MQKVNEMPLFSVYILIKCTPHLQYTCMCTKIRKVIKDNEKKKVNKSISIIEGVRDDIDFVDAPRLQIS